MTGRSNIPYRPDIDGLRAVAVLSVIVFHAGFSWAQGGFIGVDVFFVISGFLITGIVLRELRDGTFSFARFYERRARRILPAMLAVVAATLLACALVMFAADLRVVARSAVSVIAFAANIMFWRGVDFGDITTVNYFGRRLHEQPLVHTWSLGVEEQFYLLFPITVFLVWRWRPALVLPALIGGAAASLALSAWLTRASPGLAFYLLPTRGWELLAGGLLAWRGGATAPMRGPWREAAAAVGLVLVVVPAFLYDNSTPFPGIHAAVPVLGSVLLLRYAPESVTGSVLSWRPLVFVGLISYSAYLWHQPLFALTRYLSLTGEFGTATALLLCAVTLVLATATWRWIETPFRDRRLVPTTRLAWACALATIAVAAPAAHWAFAGDAGRRTPVASGILGQSVLSLFSDCNPVLQLTRRLGAGCLLDPSSGSATSFLVVGDSHADAMFPGFAKISRDTGRQGRLLQHLMCSPLLDVTDVPTGTTGCLRTRELALDMVAGERIGSVFLVSLVSRFFDTPRDLFAQRLETTIAAYADRGAVVFLVLQAPEQPRFDPRRYLRAVLRQQFLGVDATPAIDEQRVARAGHDRQQAFVASVFASYRDDPRVRVIDFTPVLCDHQACAVGSTQAPYYMDGNHLNAVGAVLVSEAIAQQWLAALTAAKQTSSAPLRNNAELQTHSIAIWTRRQIRAALENR